VRLLGTDAVIINFSKICRDFCDSLIPSKDASDQGKAGSTLGVGKIDTSVFPGEGING
jgi:hypothetical protein